MIPRPIPYRPAAGSTNTTGHPVRVSPASASRSARSAGISPESKQCPQQTQRGGAASAIG